jgi:Amt family ammonium transporter
MTARPRFRTAPAAIALLAAGLVGVAALALPGIAGAQTAAEPAAAASPAASPAAAEAAASVDPAAKLAEIEAALGDGKVARDTMWVMIAGMLVFFMNAGFALVESGLTRSKNTVNILAKNFIVFAISSIAFLVLGWGLMFGNGNGFFGYAGLLFLGGPDNSPASGDAYQGAYTAIAWATVPLYAKFFFQLVFAGTAATIVSGAVAERIKFGAFIAFSFLITGVLYPITGHWIWGGGWLASLGFWDFAGSTVVHSVGGWAALAGVLVLGPRLGKYARDGRVNPIPGHSMPLATLGALILWLGWFGFNPGSTMAAAPGDIARIALTTNTAAAMATLTATLTAWWMLGKPDLSMILNGTLAGLVAITAPCAWVSVGSSLLIGAVAGVLVVFAVLAFDRARIDDPVGALSVHLVCGVFGTLALGLFAQDDLIPNTVPNGLLFGGGAGLLLKQLTGAVAVGAFAFAASLLGWAAIRTVFGVRVSPEEEIEGLDLGEHGNEAYPEFRIGSTFAYAASQAPVASPALATTKPSLAADR